MRKNYVAPTLVCDEFVQDTMIASSGAKNGNPDNNQNCWGCRYNPGAYDPNNQQNDCVITPSNAAAYNAFC